MDFVHKRLKEIRYPKPSCKGVSVVEKRKAVNVTTLFTLVANGDPIPSMKSYNFMPANQVDLDKPVHQVSSHAELVSEARKNLEYLNKKEQYEKEKQDEKLATEKEAEKARIIAEHEAQKSQTIEPTEGAQ